MWQFVKEVPAAVKVGLGMVTGVAAAFGILLGPINANESAIERVDSAVTELQVNLTQNGVDHSLINNTLNKVLCNLDPSETWNTCEVRYRGGN